LRAFCYLNLASFYQFSYLKDKTALTAPIYTEPTTTSSVGKKKASLEEIYTLIKSDLTDADQLLQNYSRNNKDKIDRSVVNGLLARAYLNTGDWAKAAASAKIARNGYALMTRKNIKTGSMTSAMENGFGARSDTGTVRRKLCVSLLDVSSSGSYYYSFMADPYFKDLFDTNDIRYSLFSWDGNPGREGLLRYAKFKFKANLIADIVYMRAAEMYLIEAEAEARNGNVTNAVTVLNQLKSARNANQYTGSLAQNEVIKEVLIERRKELFGEGFSLSDIIRTQGTVVRKPYTNTSGQAIQVQVITPDGVVKTVNGRGHTIFAFPDQSPFVANNRYYLFSIPQKEIENNPNL
jgi:hypothetical protein